MCLSMTDLPQPEGPRTTVVWAWGMSRLIPSSTRCGPKDLWILMRRMMGGVGLLGRSRLRTAAGSWALGAGAWVVMGRSRETYARR